MKKLDLQLQRPSYKLWDYEEDLRKKEIAQITNFKKNVDVSQLQRLAFSSSYVFKGLAETLTWQGRLENGNKTKPSSKRRESKYVTHGLHPYKGKFYPQLVKAIFNIGELHAESRILDPFCGSGTVTLEGYLNGLESYGCDLNPLAVEIAQSKVKILSVEPVKLKMIICDFLAEIEEKPRGGLEYFREDCRDEIRRWFPKPVILKLSHVLQQIDILPNQKIRQFLLVTLSSIIRSVSQQEPRDLRIRKRKEPITDAPVIKLYKQVLEQQLEKIMKFHTIKEHYGGKFLESKIWKGDSRLHSTFSANGISSNYIDAVITSPPYATALPYLDTDRLSLLTVYNLSSKERNVIEEEIIGSREIDNNTKFTIEEKIKTNDFENIKSIKAIDMIKKIYRFNNNTDVGFRRKNMASLLYRYFNDLTKTLLNLDQIVIKNGSIFIIIGDNYTIAGHSRINIETTEIIRETGTKLGWNIEDVIPITVTTEGLKHIKNSIRKNAIIHFRV